MLALVLFVLEFSAILYLKAFRGYDGEHLIQYEFDPYKNILPTRNFVDTRGIRHNSQGFRHDGDVSLAKPEGTYRIFLMGGSTAYGLGGLWSHIQRDFEVIDNSETIAAFLQKDIQRALPGVVVEVVNAAITSTWTHHHLIYLNQTVLKFSPDMIVFVDGFNDYYEYSDSHDQFSSYAYQEQSHVIMGEPTLYTLAYTNMWWLYRKSAFAYLTFRTLRDLKRAFSSGPDNTPLNVEDTLPKLKKVFSNNALNMLKRISLLVESEDIEAVFVLQPMLILERERAMPSVERQLFEFNIESWKANYEAFSKEAVKLVAPLAKVVVEKNGAHFVDATRIYSGAEGQIFTDYAHLTPLGNQLLAQHIADFVIPVVKADLDARK